MSGSNNPSVVTSTPNRSANANASASPKLSPIAGPSTAASASKSNASAKSGSNPSGSNPSGGNASGSKSNAASNNGGSNPNSNPSGGNASGSGNRSNAASNNGGSNPNSNPSGGNASGSGNRSNAASNNGGSNPGANASRVNVGGEDQELSYAPLENALVDLDLAVETITARVRDRIIREVIMDHMQGPSTAVAQEVWKEAIDAVLADNIGPLIQELMGDLPDMINEAINNVVGAPGQAVLPLMCRNEYMCSLPCGCDPGCRGPELEEDEPNNDEPNDRPNVCMRRGRRGRN